MAMTIEDKLGHNVFHVDSDAHIQVNEDYSDQGLIDRLIMACPAKLYSKREDGTVEFNYEGCLECGGRIIKSWDHPIGGMGIVFRQG